MILPEPWSAPPSPKAASGQFQASKRNWWWHSDTASSTAAVTLEVSLALCYGRKEEMMGVLKQLPTVRKSNLYLSRGG